VHDFSLKLSASSSSWQSIIHCGRVWHHKNRVALRLSVCMIWLPWLAEFPCGRVLFFGWPCLPCIRAACPCSCAAWKEQRSTPLLLRVQFSCWSWYPFPVAACGCSAAWKEQRWWLLVAPLGVFTLHKSGILQRLGGCYNIPSNSSIVTYELAAFINSWEQFWSISLWL
jgi:hypothetical protein